MLQRILRALGLFGVVVVAVSGCSGGGNENRSPTAADLAVATDEDVPFAATVPISDPDGDPLTVTVLQAPVRGTVVFGSAGAFTYTPTADANGSDQFTYRASDGRASSPVATVRITIAPINDAPTILSTLELDEDQSVTEQVATEPDGDPYLLSVLTPPSHGTFTLVDASAGRIAYTPDADFNGTDSVELEALDAASTRTVATLQLVVHPVNDAPVAGDDVAVTVQTGTVVAEVLANDSDVDGDVLSVSIVSGPEHGTATVTAAGQIQYSPGAYIGRTSITYQVRDGAGATATGRLDLSSAVRSPVVYLTRLGVPQEHALFYTDGVRSFRLHDSLPAGAVIDSFKAAKTAPLVFYTVHQNFTSDLYCADLRQPGQSVRISRAAQTPGSGVGEFAINDDGSRVVYQESNASNLWLIETAKPGVEQRLSDGGTGVVLDSAGTRAFYTVIPFTPTLQPSAIYAADLANPGVIAQITPTVQPPDMVSPPLYLTRDGQRLYYSVAGSYFGVDPAQPGSDFLLMDNSVVQMTLLGPSADESSFSGISLVGGVHGYVLRVGNPGTATMFSGGTSSIGPIYDHHLTRDASRVYYLRSDAAGRYSLLYGVQMSSPSASVQLGHQPTSVWGIASFALSPDDTQIVYATLDNVTVGGGVAPGKSDIYIVPTDGSSAARQLLHFEGGATVGRFAPDGGLVVIRGGDSDWFLYALNMLDTTQFVRLDIGTAANTVSDYVFAASP